MALPNGDSFLKLFVDGFMQAHINYKTWECKDNTRINIVDMTTSHICNALHMLIQSSRQFNKDEWIEVFIKELISRGEQGLATKFILFK